MSSKYEITNVPYLNVLYVNQPAFETNLHLNQFLQSENKLITFNEIGRFSTIAKNADHPRGLLLYLKINCWLLSSNTQCLLSCPPKKIILLHCTLWLIKQLERNKSRLSFLTRSL